MRRNLYSSAVFIGGRPFCTQILPGQGRPPSIILGVRKLDTGLPDGEDRILMCSLLSTQYRIVTDGQTDGYAVSYTAQRRAVKTSNLTVY